MINEKLYTPEEVAEMFQFSAQTVRNWLTTGKLPGMKLGSRAWRIRESDIATFIADSENTKAVKG